MLDDREAETGPTERSAAAGVDAVEALGDAGDMLGRNPLALVGDREVDHRPFRLRRNGDWSAGFAVAERVGDEVVEQLQDLAAVGDDRRAALLGHAPRTFGRLPDQRLELDGLGRRGELLRLDARERDQVLDD